MTDNIFDLEQTNQALGDLSETIIKLDSVLKNKHQCIKEAAKAQQDVIATQERQLAALRATSTNVLENIDNIINRIDNILEDNGSGNNNN